MKLRFRRSAIDDLGEIRSYIAQDNPSAARRLVRAIRRRCRLMAEQPHIGRQRPELRSGLRSFPVQRYIVFYHVINDTVEIVSIVHGSRDIQAISRE